MIKMSILPELIYRFNAIPIKSQPRLFVDTDRLILKLTWKVADSRTATTILTKKWEELLYPILQFTT